MKWIICILCFLFLFNFNSSYAEEIFISFTPGFEDIVILDGTWSFQEEWKRSSLDGLNESIGFKIAHDKQYLFAYLSAVNDQTPSKLSDRGILCIDGNNNKSQKPDSDDYCFIAIMGREQIISLQGGGYNAHQGFYQEIKNHPEIIGIGGISNSFDRFSDTTHNTFEFKIPIEVIGRNNVYGIYYGVFDSNTGKQYGGPNNEYEEKYPFIPSPNVWGTLISPDKSLPEMPVPLLMLSILFFIIIIVNKTKRISIISK